MFPTVSPDGMDPLTVQWFDLIVSEWEKKIVLFRILILEESPGFKVSLAPFFLNSQCCFPSPPPLFPSSKGCMNGALLLVPAAHSLESTVIPPSPHVSFPNRKSSLCVLLARPSQYVPAVLATVSCLGLRAWPSSPPADFPHKPWRTI